MTAENTPRPDQYTLTDKQLRARLSAETRRALQTKRDLPGLLLAAQHWGVIALLALWVANGWGPWPFALVALGVMLVFQFTMMHEAVHRTAFKRVWLNKTAEWLVALLLFLPPEWFRLFHFAHHRHTQDPDKDPELSGGGAPSNWPGYLLHVSGLPLWKSSLTTLVQNGLGKNSGGKNSGGKNSDAFVTAAKAQQVTNEARLMLAVYGVIALISVVLGSALALWIWIIPILVGQPFLRLYLLAEHGRCPLVANMLENSRTTYTNRFVRWLAWNMPFHAEHHSFPTVPFHRLPALNALTKAHLASTSDGYGEFTRAFQSALKRS